ncbi:VOC family protein [Microlunatus speluncae]|uniref:VOC family protein n=1 Tax=Microlunatus speluncae TaxID=2594267 RepID=UPI0012667C10|nr:VOC family protein [Microlunatus speluncae]
MEPPKLECLCIDARDPARLGRFWAGLLETTVEESAAGTRLAYPGLDGFYLDFLPVPDREERPHRLHLDLAGGDGRDAMVQRALGLGAEHVDIGQGTETPWTVLVDPEDYAFCVMPDRRLRGSDEPMYPDSGPIGGIPIDADDIDAAATFWQAASDWQPWPPLPATFRHPSGVGPLIGFTEPVEPKRGKNPMHLDLRVSAGGDFDAELTRLLDLGARRLDHDWGDLPWTVLLDPGNNEFCLLRPRTGPESPELG